MGSSNAILKTLLYSDIFDYPLTKEQIHRYLISDKKIDKVTIESELKKSKEIKFSEGYYFLEKRKDLIKLRKKREKQSLSKLKIAQEISQKLSFIKTIELIGVSGNLALKNADKDDDIDFFIVTRKNTIWLTRILVIIALKFFGVYRKREETKIRNKICTNMFIDENFLTFLKKRKNIYTAHELVQLMVTVERNNIYDRLLFRNQWIKKYLPNVFVNNPFQKKTKHRKSNITDKLLLVINHIVKFPQILYMKKHITKEEISDRLLAFHPFDYQDYVLKKYNENLKRYNLY